MTSNHNIIDINRTRQKNEQRAAVSGLVGYCEGLLLTDLLGEVLTEGLRKRVSAVLVAFDMTGAERVKEKTDA